MSNKPSYDIFTAQTLKGRMCVAPGQLHRGLHFYLATPLSLQILKLFLPQFLVCLCIPNLHAVTCDRASVAASALARRNTGCASLLRVGSVNFKRNGAVLSLCPVQYRRVLVAASARDRRGCQGFAAQKIIAGSGSASLPLYFAIRLRESGRPRPPSQRMQRCCR